jgi:predicted extracellular nuclease
MNLVARVATPRMKRRTLATFLLALVALGALAAVAVAQMPPTSRTGIVISEFRFRGPAGGNDEFVELRNSSTSPIDISGFKLQGCSSGTPGTASDRATIDQGVTLNPGQSFLFANSTASGGFSGMVEPDETFSTGFTDLQPNNQSGAQIVDAGGARVDGVGSVMSPCREGTGLVTPADPATGVDQSFERAGGTVDTDNNINDFQGPKPGMPQNRTTNPGTEPGGGEPGPGRTGIVISEFRVRGPGGGNDEFFELRNTSTAPIDISGFELQGCASGDGNPTRRAVVADDTSLDPDESFLFANSSGSGGFSGGVPADQTFGTGISDFLADNQSGARIVDGETVVDGVGSPTSPCREGTGILTPATNTDSSFERLGGTQDTDNNSTDFQPKTPSGPENTSEAPDEAEPTLISEIQGEGQTSPFVEEPASSSSPGSTGEETVTIEGVVTGVDDEVGQSNSGRIFENERGIFVQEEADDQDEDDDTSEAIFVGFVRDPKAFYTPGPEGQVVRVTGRVRELFGFTILEEQIGQEPRRVGTAPQPMPEEIDEEQAEGQDSSASDPDADEEAAGRDYYESLESMRVQFTSSTANSGGTNKFDELFLTPGSDPTAGPGGESGGERDRVFREGGDPVEEEEVPELFATDEDAGSMNPTDPGNARNAQSTTVVRADLFDTASNVVGPFAFNFNNYKVMVQEDREPAVNDTAGVVYPFQVRPEDDGGLKSFEAGEDVRVVSYNINNFFDNVDDPDTDDEIDDTSDPEPEKRRRAVDAINDILKRPDVISLQEVENKAVLDRLADDLGGYTGVLFEGRDERGIDNAFLIKDGGEEGGGDTGGGGGGGGDNDDDTGGGDTGGGQAVAQEPGGGDSIVSFSNPRQLGLDEETPERVPDDQECSDEEGFLFDRPPTSVDIETEDGREFTVFGSHFASKGGPNERRQCREEQARFLGEQVKEVQDGTRDDGETGGGETSGGGEGETGGRETAVEGEGSEAIVAGDLNAFEDEEPLQILEEEGGLDNLWDEEDEELRYSFQFQGRLQTLDHILVTEGLNEDLQAFQYAHFNVDYYEREAPTPGTPTTDGHKLSVHDPPIFTLGPPEDGDAGGGGDDDDDGGRDGNDRNRSRNGGNGKGGSGNGNGDDDGILPGLGGVLGTQVSSPFRVELKGVRSCARNGSFVVTTRLLGAAPAKLRLTVDGRKLAAVSGRGVVAGRVHCRGLRPGLHRIGTLGIDSGANRLGHQRLFRVRRARR